jgi:hypothetical protein
VRHIACNAFITSGKFDKVSESFAANQLVKLVDLTHSVASFTERSARSFGSKDQSLVSFLVVFFQLSVSFSKLLLVDQQHHLYYD